MSRQLARLARDSVRVSRIPGRSSTPGAGGSACVCDDCEAVLMIRPIGFLCSGGGWDGDWCMLKDHVWRSALSEGKCRFLCVKCIEKRIGRKLIAIDFRRSAEVNFLGAKSKLLRRRMRGLMPAKRLRRTVFVAP